MKLIRIHIISAKTCGGLLDGFDRVLRFDTEFDDFAPLCLIGPNGSGKSQLMQLLAEIFQSVFHELVPDEEQDEANANNQFEIEYMIRPGSSRTPVHVKLNRQIVGKRKTPTLKIQLKETSGWVDCDLSEQSTIDLLPTKVVGYTSGENETLSLPFLISRGAYADKVGRIALKKETRSQTVPDTRLMFIDYGTNLEVLVANLLFGSDEQRDALLREARVERLHSCRCVIQLNHSAVTSEVKLTDELEEYIDKLQLCATTHHYIAKTKTFIFDFWINDATRTAFQTHWPSAFDLYSAFHKLAMLDDLAIKRTTRRHVRKQAKERRFAARLPEPSDQDKVFRFERVKFISRIDGSPVDYVSLSDGEHQLCQLLGVLMMQDSRGTLFLLDEPESHFNPAWRVKCVSMFMGLPTNKGKRSDRGSEAAEQDCLLTTHAPFIPSDLPRNRVLIFKKEEGKAEIRHPNIETYGTTFDAIIEECFGVIPPISKMSFDEIEALKKSTSVEELKAAIKRLGHSVEKALLMEKLLQLQEKAKS
ncbi:MAG: restriction system-associated AAA family ATPase [Planctomycetota bacterium]